MGEFRWGGGGQRSVRGEKKDALDVLIAAAGGDPLPGMFGLLQGILNVWTTSPPMPGSSKFTWVLWGGRSVLNTLGVVRSFQRATSVSTSRMTDLVEDYVDGMGIREYTEFDDIGIMIHLYAEQGLPREDNFIGPDNKISVRRFTLPDGVHFYYIFRVYSSSSDYSAAHRSWSGLGPYIRPEDFDPFLRGIGRYIWKVEGESDLQLSLRSNGYDKSTMEISNIGAPDDYISEGALMTSVTRLADRCTALMEKGFTRKILFAGPPGCGKTTLARNLARQLGGGHALRIHPEVVQHHAVARIMRIVRLLSPRVILFDDLDRNQSDTTEILHYMEQAGNVEWTRGMLVIGTVNTLQTLDPAMFRPGRFDEVQYVNEPTGDHRVHIIEHYLNKFGVQGLELTDLCQMMDGFSPADIREVLTVVSAIGNEHLADEVARVGRQRGLHAGGKVGEFLTRKSRDDDDDDEYDGL